MSRLADIYRRWRHGRGFGVHSPYAFRMVNDVLRLPPDYAYYAYDDIARERHRLQAPVPLAEAFLIFRAVNEFQPSLVAILARGPLERLLCSIVRLASPGAEISHDIGSLGGEGCMLIAYDAPAGALPAGCHAFLAGSALAALPARMPFGHIYRSSRRAIVAARPHLPFQTFDIKF